MKNLLLAFCFIFINTISSQENLKNFTGTWEEVDKKTDYTLVISKHKKTDHFKFLNFKPLYFLLLSPQIAAFLCISL